MTPQSKDRLQALLSFLASEGDRLTMDADTHITDPDGLPDFLQVRMEESPDYFHGRPISAEELVAEMDVAGVDMALTWQNPIATCYTDDPEENCRRLLNANRYVFESARAHPRRFVPGGWVDPKACGLEQALEMAEILVNEFGFIFVKMNPAQNAYPIDSDLVLEVTRHIVELGAVPAFHFGADTPYTPASGLEKIAAEHPEHPVLAIHMGGGGAGYVEAEPLYQQARELGLKYPNIGYALSAKRDTHMESDFIAYLDAGLPHAHQIFCASDAPYGRVAWNYGGFRAMLEGLRKANPRNDPRLIKNPGLFDQAAVRNFLGANFARWTYAAGTCLLERHA